MKLAPAWSRTIALDENNVPATNSLNSTPLPSAAYVDDSDVPKPVVLHLSVEVPPANTYANASLQHHYFAGLPDGQSPIVSPSYSQSDYGCAALVLEYGAGSALRKVVMDLKPGSYQLPPCTQVKTSVLAYRGASDFTPRFVPCSVGVTLCPGTIITNPARPVVTHGQKVQGSGPSGYNVISPGAARWWDLWWGSDGSIAPLATTAPDLLAQCSNLETVPAAGLLYRAYSSGVFMPCWGPAEFGSPENTNIQVTDGNTASVAMHLAWLRFFLEL